MRKTTTATFEKDLTGTLFIGSVRYPRSIWHCQFEPPYGRVEDLSDRTNKWLTGAPTNSITGWILEQDRKQLKDAASEPLKFETDEGLTFDFSLDREGFVKFGRWL